MNLFAMFIIVLSVAGFIACCRAWIKLVAEEQREWEMKKALREQVYKKFNGRCAYCGCELPKKGFHVDHIIPQDRYSEQHQCLIVDGRKFTDYGLHDLQNLNPACRRCNLWKRVSSLEEFRSEIEAQKERLKNYSAGFRLAQDFGVVISTNDPVKFYYEKGSGK